MRSRKYTRTPAVPTVSKALQQVLIQFSEGNDISLETICAKQGVRLPALTDGNERIHADQFSKIWDLAERASGDQNFGLHFGKELARNYLQGNILVSMMANSATVGNAISIFCKYHRLMEDAVLPEIAIAGSTVFIWWQFFVPEISIPRQHAECLLCASSEILQMVSGEQIKPEAVFFSHCAPDDICEHQKIFKCKVVFDQPRNGLQISRKDSDRPITLANADIMDALEPIAEKHLWQIYASGSWSERVGHEIRLMMSRGEAPDIKTVSANMALGPRSLQMKLKREETTFQKLLDRLRHKAALAYLENPEVAICDIALLLGFSEQSAFNHAFKRWTGTSPGEFRKGSSTPEKS